MIFIEYGRKIINVVMEDISYTCIYRGGVYNHSYFSCSDSIKIGEIGTVKNEPLTGLEGLCSDCSDIGLQLFNIYV